MRNWILTWTQPPEIKSFVADRYELSLWKRAGKPEVWILKHADSTQEIARTHDVMSDNEAQDWADNAIDGEKEIELEEGKPLDFSGMTSQVPGSAAPLFVQMGLEQAKSTQQPDSDGWMEHTAMTEMPIDGGIMCHVKLADGSIIHKGHASGFNWEKTPSPNGHITHYKIIEEPAKVEPIFKRDMQQNFGGFLSIPHLPAPAKKVVELISAEELEIIDDLLTSLDVAYSHGMTPEQYGRAETWLQSKNDEL